MSIDISHSISFLRELIKDAPGAEVAGVDDLSPADKIRAVVMCCARIIEFSLVKIANDDAAEALVGLDELVAGMRQNIKNEYGSALQ